MPLCLAPCLAAVPGQKPQPQTARRALEDLPTTFALGALFYPIPRAGKQKEIQSKVQVNPA